MNSCLPFNSSNPSEYRLIFSLLFRHSLPPKLNILTPLMSAENCKQELVKDGNESKEANLSNDRVCESETQEESYRDLCVAIAAELEQRVSRLERLHRERKMARMKGSDTYTPKTPTVDAGPNIILEAAILSVYSSAYLLRF
ncbi:hypothetical protein L195_g024140 [Trifolium pratense]|uniref:Uncharacterized protein n=1 Tax=Trifolium pratense TaxID=57577 RepID=A0A2K3NCV8_TRIPR|nr:hypothetical protein L195_g024140 [Trifolium pratense]